MGRPCVVADCSVHERTSSKSPIFNHVHPTARGMMFRLSAERQKMWKDILHLERITSSELMLVCSRHFSMLQYNEIRLSRGCRFNILTQDAIPDIFLPGIENSPDAIMYKDIYPIAEPDDQVTDTHTDQSAEGETTESNLPQKGKVSPAEIPEIPPEKSLESEVSPSFPEMELFEEMLSNVEQGASRSEKDVRKTDEAKNNPANILLSNVALKTSKSYETLLGQVYKNHQVPDYAKKEEYFYAKNVSEVVARRFLTDTVAAFKKTEKEKQELEKLIMTGSQIIRSQQSELDKVQKDKDRILVALKKRFSKAQLDRILDDKKSNWDNTDYQKAITLLGVSDKAYKVTRELLKIPLPARSAVKKLLSNIDMSEGILQGVLDLIQTAGNLMSDVDRQVSLCFDEVQLNNKHQVTYNTSSDKVQGPHKLMQTAIISGIFSKFSNPVFYKNSCPMTESVLFEIVDALHEAGFYVRMLVCDLGLDNQALMKKLGVSEEKPYFQHRQSKIYVWGDPPHCVKLLRNHLLDTGIDLAPDTPGREVASKQILQALVSKTAHDEIPPHPLRQEHLNAQGCERQRCHLARETLDCRVAEALEKLAAQGDLNEEEALSMKATAEVCRIGNLFADLFGVASDLEDGSIAALFVSAQKLPFGRQLEAQERMLQKIYESIGTWRVFTKQNKARTALMAFQRGMMMACLALPMLLKDLREEFPEEKLEFLTARLTQDIVERFFGLLRTLFGPNQRPDAVEAARRLKNLVLGNNLGIVSKKCNVSISDIDKNGLNILTLKTLGACSKNIDEAREGGSASTADLAEEQGAAPASVIELSDQEEENEIKNTEEDDMEEDESEDELDVDEVEEEEHYSEQDEMGDLHLIAVPTDWTPPDTPHNPDYKIGLSHIAEAIAGKLGGKFPELIDQQKRTQRPALIPNWIPKSMQKNCAPASSFLSNVLRKCDVIFREVNKNSLDRKEGIVKRLKERALREVPQLPAEVAASFFLKRLRTRIAAVNTELWEQRSRKSSNRQKGYEEELRSRAAKRRKLYI